MSKRKKLAVVLPALVFAIFFGCFAYLIRYSQTYQPDQGLLAASIWSPIALVIGTIFGIVASAIANMAERKGRSWNVFFYLALLLPVLMLIIAAVMSTDSTTATVGTKACPRCAELVKKEASLCKHCGSEIALQ